jgi:hypothetical protein
MASSTVKACRARSWQFRDIARAAGRDPARLEVIVGAFGHIMPDPLAQPRQVFTGSAEQVREDIVCVREFGAAELFFALNPDRPLDELLTTMERLWGLMEEQRS